VTRKPGRPVIPEATKVADVDGMAILAGPIAAITSRKHDAPVKPEDPLLRDWRDIASPDSWGVRAVYDFGAFQLLARELERWADRFGGEHGEELLRRAAWLRSDKTPGVSS
jgi:hypothetical protein